MADTIVTVASAGADYNTIQAAVDAADVSSGRWIIELDEDVAFDETVSISSVVGTPTDLDHILIRPASGRGHTGVAGTGHPRVIPDAAGGHAFHVQVDHTVIQGLEIKLESPAASDECVRVEAEEVLLTRCIMWTDSTVADTSAVYVGDWDASVSIDNSVIYGFTRAGVHIQQYTSANPRAITLNLDHAVIYGCGATSEGESGAVYLRSSNVGDVIEVNAYNSAFVSTPGSYTDLADGNASGRANLPTGTITWNGSHNLRTGSLDDVDGTDNTTDWQVASSGTTDSTPVGGAWFVVAELTAGIEDFTIDSESGNLASNLGTNRQNSTPDTRQDFSTDIAGNPRPTTNVDIGASTLGAGIATQDIDLSLLNLEMVLPNPTVDSSLAQNVSLELLSVELTLPQPRTQFSAGDGVPIQPETLDMTMVMNLGRVQPGPRFATMVALDLSLQLPEPTLDTEIGQDVELELLSLALGFFLPTLEIDSTTNLGVTLAAAGTLGEHVDSIHRIITGTNRGIVNQLSDAITVDDTSITFASDPLGITAGSWLGIETEIIYVVSLEGRTATVQRGMFDTQAGPHPVDARIEVNWRYFTADVLDAIRKEILSWDSEVYRPVHADPIPTGNSRGYTAGWAGYLHLLIAGLIRTGDNFPIDVIHKIRDWPSIGGEDVVTLDIQACETGVLHVTYAAEFTVGTLTLSTVMATDLGLNAHLTDVCQYGAMARLIEGQAGSRVDRMSQPQPRTAEEVGPLDEARLASTYRASRDRRLGEERDRLRHLYPPRFS